jgi:hypothetical protein
MAAQGMRWPCWIPSAICCCACRALEPVGHPQRLHGNHARLRPVALQTDAGATPERQQEVRHYLGHPKDGTFVFAWGRMPAP